MNTNIADDFALLEEMATRAEVDEQWVDRSLEWLSIEWNQILADNLFSYLLLKQDGSFFLDDPFVLPSKQEQINGEFNLGTVLGRDEVVFRLRLNDVPKHILAMGTSGSGKTNFGLVLAEQAYLNGVRSIRISDPKADEFEVLAKKYPDFLMLRWNDLRFNLLTPPPNVPRNEWNQTITGHMAERFKFWVGAESLTLKLMLKVSGWKSEPVITDMLRALKGENPRFRQKDFMIMATVGSRLELMLNTLGNVITTESTMLEELSSRKYILSSTGMMSETESWLLEFMLIWEFMYRVFNPDKRELTLHLYDECQHRLFSSSKERDINRTSSSQISMLVDESRAMNIGICSMSQEPSILLKSVLNNSFLKVAFHLGSGDEISTASNAMGLDEEQKQALHYLETGEAIVRMAGGFMEPFPVKIKRFQKAVAVNDAEFWQHQKEMKERLYRDSGVVEGDKTSGRDWDGGGDEDDDQDSDWETYDVL